MPTHFSKLEGSPLNMQRERMRSRRRKHTATTTSLPPSFGFVASVGSNDTACEGIHFDAFSPFERDRSEYIPQFINVQNSKRLPRTRQQQQQQQQDNRRTQQHQHQHQHPNRLTGQSSNNDRSNKGHRPPQYDMYCQTRVSAISSLPSHNDHPTSFNRRSNSSIEREQRDDNDHYALPPRGPPLFLSRQKQTIAKRNTIRRHHDNTTRSNHHIVYDLSSTFAPSEPSTITTSSMGRRSRVMHPLVNAHGVFGSNGHSSSNNRNKHKHDDRGQLSSSRRSRAKSAPESVRHLKHSIAENYGDPYFGGTLASRRRKDVVVTDDNSFESQNEASLIGERFADVYSDTEDPPKKISGSRYLPLNIDGSRRKALGAASADGNDKIRTDNFRQQQQQHNVATKWLCDVCKEARFDTYVEAYRHEIECRGHKNKIFVRNSSSTKETKPLQQHQQYHTHRGYAETKPKDSSDRNRINGSNHHGEFIGNHMQEMSLSSSTESLPSNHCRTAMLPIASSNHCRIATLPIAPERKEDRDSMSNNDSVASKEATRWLCSVCKEISFDNYPDACSHEKVCKIRMEATADLRGAADSAVARDKPTRLSAPLPPSHRTQTRDSSTDKILTVATTDLWEAAEKLKGAKHPPPSIYHTQQGLDNGNQYNSLANYPPERRQDESAREAEASQISYETMDIIERERDRHSLTDSSRGKIYDDRNPAEACDDRCHAFDTNAGGNFDNVFPDEFVVPSERTMNHKGEAYDRYVLLASQQDEEEERERYIALAKQTREEELLSYRQGDNGDERYVCLA